MPDAPHSAVIRISLPALQANYAELRKRSAGDCAGVVKADGYGLGIEPVGSALAEAGCREFFVATAMEGVRLRRVLPAVSIRVLEGVFPTTIELLREARLEPVIASPRDLELWRAAGAPGTVTVHLDTGMERLGLSVAEQSAIDWGGVDVSLVMTHYVEADRLDSAVTRAQRASFEERRRPFSGVRTSMANSAGCLLGRDHHGDLTRPGIGLYGGHPRNLTADNPMRPVVGLFGRVLRLRDLPAGTTLGYWGTHRVERASRIAVVGVGYADGLPRLLSNRGAVAFAGARLPIVGRVSMDVVQVDATDLSPEAALAADDWVELFGAHLGLDEVAGWADTIGLEILCGLGGRPRRDFCASL
ncbi:MAG: alanine racemase [Pseudomonadota bacterium]